MSLKHAAWLDGPVLDTLDPIVEIEGAKSRAAAIELLVEEYAGAALAAVDAD
jgi:hypothetical protein